MTSLMANTEDGENKNKNKNENSNNNNNKTQQMSFCSFELPEKLGRTGFRRLLGTSSHPHPACPRGNFYLFFKSTFKVISVKTFFFFLFTLERTDHSGLSFGQASVRRTYTLTLLVAGVDR